MRDWVFTRFDGQRLTVASWVSVPMGSRGTGRRGVGQRRGRGWSLGGWWTAAWHRQHPGRGRLLLGGDRPRPAHRPTREGSFRYVRTTLAVVDSAAG